MSKQLTPEAQAALGGVNPPTTFSRVLRFKSKVVEIEAVQLPVEEAPAWLADAMDAETVWMYRDGSADIRTLEGIMKAKPGDWIIRGTEGELYPCKPSVFERKYEPA